MLVCWGSGPNSRVVYVYCLYNSDDIMNSEKLKQHWQVTHKSVLCGVVLVLRYPWGRRLPVQSSCWPQFPPPASRVCRATRPVEGVGGWGCCLGAAWSVSAAKSWCRAACRWCGARGRAGWCRYCTSSEIFKMWTANLIEDFEWVW